MSEETEIIVHRTIGTHNYGHPVHNPSLRIDLTSGLPVTIPAGVPGDSGGERKAGYATASRVLADGLMYAVGQIPGTSGLVPLFRLANNLATALENR